MKIPRIKDWPTKRNLPTFARPNVGTMPLEVLAKEIFDQYVLWWRGTASVREKKYLRNPAWNDERKAFFVDFIVWTRDQGMEPVTWLLWCFRVRNWRFPPKLTAGHLMNPKSKALASYKHQTMLSYDSTRLAKPFDPNVDISPTVEQTKARYLQQGMAMSCFAGMYDATFGYHPRSGPCQMCPMAQRCKAQLVKMMPFDIMALRTGKLSVPMARQKALEAARNV